jgi:hypothetical protein
LVSLYEAPNERLFWMIAGEATLNDASAGSTGFWLPA